MKEFEKVKIKEERNMISRSARRKERKGREKEGKWKLKEKKDNKEIKSKRGKIVK